jgi:serine/threonine protein kinase
MSPPPTGAAFLELTVKSGLLDAKQLQAYLQQRGAAGALPGGPRALANVLVRDGLLTRFQAEQLLLGRWRHFVIAGKYRVLGPLGSGGMGQVYLAEHRVMQRRVALKVLPGRSTDPVTLERFRREGRAVAALDHPNIVRAHDIDHDGALHFLVLEYVDGSTLYTIINKWGPMDPLRAAHYVRQAALGLQHAHEAGLVHRDIKPSNLLLDRAGTVKVLDLGLVRFFHDQSDDLSQWHAGSPVGTLEYMAPEQALNSHEVDIRSDIYGLGATFYCLLAGHGPFRGRASSGMPRHHPAEQPRPIREIRPDVPEGLAAVLDRMMARERAERYQTPAEVAAALGPWTQTPIPPPPPQEMPLLLAPAQGPSGPGGAPGLPASLYEPPLSPTPSPGGPEVASLPMDSALPTAPALDTAWGPPPTPVLGEAPPTGGPASQPTRPPEPDGGGEAPAPAGKRRRRRVLLAAAAVLLLGACAAALAVYERTAGQPQTAASDTARGGDADKGGAAGASGPARLRLLVPAYFYPADEGLEQWGRLLESPTAAATLVVVNRDSGPGAAADPNYAKVLRRAQDKRVTVLGYVRTEYGKRPPDEVKADVDRWVRFYPGIRGMFFDEQASAADRVDYYAALYEYVRKDRGLALVVTNPGGICAEEYVARPASDVVCLAEANRDFSTYHRPAWSAKYPADRFAALLYDVGSRERMKNTLLDMRTQGIGYCFITDGKWPNPWDRLPRYWGDEVEAVQQATAP